MRKEVAQIIKKASKVDPSLAFYVSGNHIKVYRQDVLLMTIALTPSCHRAIDNIRADFRRYCGVSLS